MSSFSPRQQQSFAVAFMDVHDRLTHMESFIAQADRATPFGRYVGDMTADERKVVQDYFMQIRDAMQALLAANQIPLQLTPNSLRWALETGLVYVQVAVEEMSPERLRGYGTLTPEGQDAALAIKQELSRIVEQAIAFVRQPTQ
jgi:hypothetical protein